MGAAASGRGSSRCRRGRGHGKHDQGSAYAVDSLFRRDLSAAPAAGTGTVSPVMPDMSAAQNSPAASTAEVGRIFANGLRSDAALSSRPSPKDFGVCRAVAAYFIAAWRFCGEPPRGNSALDAA